MLNKTKHNTKNDNTSNNIYASVKSKLLFYAILEYERYLRNKKCQMQ